MRLSRRAVGTASKLLVPAGFLAGVVATTQVPPPPPPIGGPLQGLSQAELQRFTAGRGEFLQIEQRATGLGPVFNGTSCVQCHNAAAPGGASSSLGVSVVTRIGAQVNGQYSDLEAVGGALLQRRSLREMIANYPVPGEIIPQGASFVGRRQTTPVFGIGLIEAIPASQILSRQDPTDLNRDGISGRANMVLNRVNNQTEVGRFGWKCQLSSVHMFSADAYLNEMGITNPLFPVEVRPQGRTLPPGADTVADPEDVSGVAVARLTDFMRFLAPPAPSAGTTLGRSLFASVGCASCHTPTMTTGAHPSAALAFKPVNLYSDLLVHDMGPGLADNLRQGQATGTEFRSAPLWGLRFRRFFLHDGRAQSIDSAIRLHGGEAVATVGRYNALTATNRSALISFVQGL